MFLEAIDYFLNYCKEHKKKYKNIYAVPRGGYIVGLYLSHKLNIPMINDKFLECPEKGKTLICEDICDEGNELSKDYYIGCDKFVLIAKNKGNYKVKPITQTIVADYYWVVFDWER